MTLLRKALDHISIRRAFIIGLVLGVILGLASLPANAQTICEGYGSTSSTVYTSESQVNADMNEGDDRVADVTIDIDNFSNDMVNVPSGKRITFARVTFAGSGGDGHLLEVKNNSSVRVYRSAFVGAGEDDVQLENHKWSVFGDINDPDSGNCFDSNSAEDAIDIKDTPNTSRNVGINRNEFRNSAQWCVLANNGEKQVYFRENVCAGGAYFRGGVHDALITNNTFHDGLWLDDVDGYTVGGNDLERLRHGAGGNNPSGTAVNGNDFSGDGWDYRGGTCTHDGANTGAVNDLTSTCAN